MFYLTTVGAKSGQRRMNPVARFEDGAGGWLIVASFAGAAQYPAWYHNVAANPGQVWAEVNGTTTRVKPEQLLGDEYDAAWKQITTESEQFLATRRRRIVRFRCCG